MLTENRKDAESIQERLRYILQSAGPEVEAVNHHLVVRPAEHTRAEDLRASRP